MHRSLGRKVRSGVGFIGIAVVSAFLIVGQTGLAQAPIEQRAHGEKVQAAKAETTPADKVEGSAELHPLATKQEMIRDRFQRFQDRVFRLREQIADKEPENAARLARALSRAGELELAAKLDELIESLRDPAKLSQAAESQAKWMEDADKLLSILLEQDSQNEERRNEIERLQQYQKRMEEILAQQQGLRNQSADAVEAKRMAAQLEAAIKRLEAMIAKQGGLTEATRRQADEGAKEKSENLAAQVEEMRQRQEELSREAERLAKDLEQLSQKPEGAPTASQVEAAKSMTQSAAQSMQSGSKSMSEAGERLAQRSPRDAQQAQQEAEKSLQEAKKQLEEAKRALEEQEAAQSGGEQRGLAQQTKSLSQQMQQDAQAGAQGKSGKSGKSGSQSKSDTSRQKLDQAEQSMEDAAESLDDSSPERAIPDQDEAIEQLQAAKQELEEELQKLRKEEREETLRDLEARFRDMLAKQKPINEATASLDRMGKANFKRAEELQLADLSTAQRALAQKALMCLHILDEEGTTVAFPRVVGQLAEDMNEVADRLGALDTGTITQAIEQEILDTLTQLLDAVKRMQQENEQQGSSGGQMAGGNNQPLLPPSAELKLLKASQLRINTRTTAIDSGLSAGTESPQRAASSLQALAARQAECSEIARKMKEKMQP